MPIPAARRTRRTRPLSALLAPPPGARGIVVADPDALRMEVLSELLRTDGHDVHPVVDRTSLQDRLRVELPDLVLLAGDLGHEAVLDVRSRDPGRRCPLMVYAAEDPGEEEVVQSLLAGADDFFLWSHRIGELGARIQVQLRNRRDRELLAWATDQVGELRTAALLDPLTGISNRRVVDAGLQSALDLGRPILLAIVDLDHFKLVNDTCGHPVGDHVLRATASALERTSRRGDVVARFGGEEFVVLIPDARASAVLQIGERLRLAVRDMRLPPDLGVLRVTASVGVAWWDGTPPAPTAAALVELCDRALYEAKDLGRDQVVVHGWVGAAPWGRATRR